jgi:hypothetical protein
MRYGFFSPFQGMTRLFSREFQRSNWEEKNKLFFKVWQVNKNKRKRKNNFTFSIELKNKTFSIFIIITICNDFYIFLLSICEKLLRIVSLNNLIN